jgi:DNA (cytosine-5)-methyltransferase 1
MALTFGSLFAGVGGFDMGFEQAGWDCKFQVEWDKNCQQILNKHWPDVPKWLDVSDVNGAEIPPVDCIIFGSPCQDLSVAGKRAGLEGERSGLFHEAVRIIKEMRDATNGTFPRWTVWENVAGALSSNNGRDFGTVINEMAKAGAHLQEYALLDAQHFGIPQRRRRVFLVSCFDSATAERCPDPLLPVTESVRGDSKKGKQKGQSASRTLTEGFGGDGAIVNAIGASIYHKSTVVNQDVNCGHLVTEDVAEPYVKSRRAQTSTDDETWVHGEVNPTLNSFDVGDTRATTAIVEPVLFENSYRDGARIANHGVTQTLSAKMGTGGGNTPMIALPTYSFDTQFGSNANVTENVSPTLKASQQSPSIAHISFYDGYNQKLDDSGIHRSLRIGRDSSDFIAQPAEPTMAVRRLTPLECERLMGWPDDHTRFKADGTEQADTHRYKQCGNGVASPVARWVAEHMKKATHEG